MTTQNLKASTGEIFCHNWQWKIEANPFKAEIEKEKKKANQKQLSLEIIK